MNVENRNKLARAIYLENRSIIKGVDMIKKNHVLTKDITADMKLFKEEKDGKVISTYFDRVEIRKGNELQIIKL